MGLPAPNLLVTPSLKLVRQLTTGTMGSIWVAEHLTLKTQFAVKFISQGLIEADPTALVRFTNEARAAGSIKSPHVVNTSDYGVTNDGEPYIVMELLDGETLHDRILRDGPMDPVLVAATMVQVCRGLSAAHDKGILHRDIKPENIFLCAGDEPPLVKLIDFGLAKLTQGDTSLMPTAAGARVGTPAFMSPEQIVAEGPIDHRADLWGAAVVTYHALTGRHPFRGKNVAVFRANVEKQIYTLVTDHRADLPATANDFFHRALQVDPKKRFASASELAEQLIEALGVADDLPPFPTGRASMPSLSGLRFRSSADRSAPHPISVRSEPPAALRPDGLDSAHPPSRLSADGLRLSEESLLVQRQLQRRSTFFATLCVVLAAIAIALALR